MRRPRRKPRHQPTVFHCTSRAVGGQFLFDELDKQQFRNLMYKHTAFCEMKVLTHTILDNHFHILCRGPGPLQLTDQQILTKLQAFYGPRSRQALEFQNALKKSKATPLAKLRSRYLARIGDLSVFFKELKQAFSRWYNKRHERYGTLWAERFSSTVVEDGPGAALAVAELLRMRVRYFTDGVVIGTKKYVEEFFARYYKEYVPKRKSGARRMKGGDWGGLMTMRDLQKNVIG
jgi:putative transposase